MISRNVAFLSAAFFFSSVGSLHAQQLNDDADADRLFKEGQKLMEERRFADACPKLESAYHKDKQLGTLLNLAYCHKEMGSTWVAWTEFREAEGKATEQKRRDFAHDKMKELEKNLAKLVIDPQTRYVISEIDLEDRHIFDAEKGGSFAAEPGQRKVTFHANGKKPATALVTVASVKEQKGTPQHVQVPEMTDEDPVPVAPVETPPAPTTTTSPPPEQNRSTWSTQKTLAIAAGAVGVVGIAVGSIFGVTVLSSSCAIKGKTCPAADRDSASTHGAIATVSFIAGGALVAGAIVLWITAPKTSSSAAIRGLTVQADLGPTWAGLHGTF